MAKYCINCGKELQENESKCSQCGLVTNNSTNPGGNLVANSGKNNGLAIAGLVISIVSLVLCCGSLSWLSLIFSIVGVVSAKNYEGKGKNMSIAGIIISVVGMILLIVLLVLAPVLGYTSTSKKIENKWDSINDRSNNIPRNNSNYYDYDDDYDDIDY